MRWMFLIILLVLHEVYCVKVIYHRNGSQSASNGTQIIYGIVGGTVTSITKYKYQAQILYSSNPGIRSFQQICGGSVISSTIILCAAHCVIDKPEKYAIIVGSSTRNSGGLKLAVISIVIHPGYVAEYYDNDASIFIVKQNMLILTNVEAIPLRSANDVLNPGMLTTVTGWGTTKESGSFSTNLREVSVPYISLQTCDQMYWGREVITRNMLCTIQSGGGKDSCQGDSGGGLVATFGDTRKLIGIVSWGAGCARSDSPGVYTDVTSASVSKFISDTLAANQ